MWQNQNHKYQFLYIIIANLALKVNETQGIIKNSSNRINLDSKN